MESSAVFKTMVDLVVGAAFVTVLAGAVVYYRQHPVLIVIALFAMMGSFMVSYSTAKAEALHIPPPSGIMRRPERAFYLTLGAAFSPVAFDWTHSYITFDGNVGLPFVVAMSCIAVLANVSAIERLWTIGRLVREREHLASSTDELTKTIQPDNENA